MKKRIIKLVVLLSLASGCAKHEEMEILTLASKADSAEHKDVDWDGDLDLDTYKGPCAPWAVNVAINQLNKEFGEVVSQDEFEAAGEELGTDENGQVGTTGKNILDYFINRGYETSLPKKIESCDQYAEMAGAIEQGCSVLLVLKSDKGGHVETVKSIDSDTCSGKVNSMLFNLAFEGIGGDFKLDSYDNYDGEDSIVRMVKVCGR